LRTDTPHRRYGYDVSGNYHVPVVKDSAAVVKDNPTGEDVWPLDHDQCPDCRCAPNEPHSPDCEGDLLDKAADTKLTPEVSDDEREQGKSADKSVDIPLSVQVWIFDSLADVMLERLHEVIDSYHDTIIALAGDRFVAGYEEYGDTMYGWSHERRLDEVLQEIADSIVYLTSGPIE
jgi:hypothetical protein